MRDNKTNIIKTPDIYKLVFNAYSKTVVCLEIKAYSVREAINKAGKLLGFDVVDRCLMSVEITCPF